MPRTRVDTRSEIREIAAELFARQGYDKTSLREVAERLGITKAALYYHFPSKSDLMLGIVQPFVDDVEVLLAERESQPIDALRFLEDYFEVVLRHRKVFELAVRDAGALAQLGVVEQLVSWRERVYGLLVGPDASPAQVAKATVAVGGLQDCALSDADAEEFRDAALTAARAALES